MTAPFDVPATDRGLALRRKVSEHRFYLFVTLCFCLIALFAFAQTYYFRWLFRTPPLPFLLHVHAFVMSGWVALLVVQSLLISTNRVSYHRRIGIVGAGWALLVFFVGITTTVNASIREVRAHSPLMPMQLAISGLEVVQMLFFAAYVSLAIYWRRRSDFHKRLMLLTIACMLPSVLARLPFEFISNTIILAGLDVFIVGCATFDAIRNRRLHPVFIWGGGSFIAAFHIALPLVQTQAWTTWGTRLLD
jgi:hypothetical protein